MAFVVTGGAAQRAGMKAMTDRVEAATKAATVAAATLVANEMKSQLALSTHPKGTPTTSAPGSPPALVSGQLRRSIKTSVTRVAPGVYQGRIGPSAVYGRVQDLGGQAGRGGSVRLPARPYVQPALRTLMKNGRLAAAYRSRWLAAMGMSNV